MTISLEMVPLEKLRIDHAAEGGYARALSEDRIRKRRKDWNIRKVGTIEVVRRQDGSMWLVDGQHRREVALEKGVAELPAVVHSDLTIEEEADLYLGKADAFPQQALAQFAARLRRGDSDARGIKAAVESVGLRIAPNYAHAHADNGQLVAVQRLERIYKQAGGATLRAVLQLAHDLWGIDHRVYQQGMLEALYQFYVAYHTLWDEPRLKERLQAVGIEGVLARAFTVQARGGWKSRVDTLIVALHEIYHEPKLRSHTLPAWTGKRRPVTEDGVKPFARGSREAIREKARQEREQLRIVG